jgi:2,5-diketo-D-gluconate reductase A
VNNLLTLNNGGVTMPALGFGVFRSAPRRPWSPSRPLSTPATGTSTPPRSMETSARSEKAYAAPASTEETSFSRQRSGVSDYGYDETLHAFDKSATKLGVSQIDLLILHQPMPQHFERTVEAYRALERLLNDVRIRSIGVSNFMPHHLAALRERTEVVPAANQIELHRSTPWVRAVMKLTL